MTTAKTIDEISDTIDIFFANKFKPDAPTLAKFRNSKIAKETASAIWKAIDQIKGNLSQYPKILAEISTVEWPKIAENVVIYFIECIQQMPPKSPFESILPNVTNFLSRYINLARQMSQPANAKELTFEIDDEQKQCIFELTDAFFKLMLQQALDSHENVCENGKFYQVEPTGSPCVFYIDQFILLSIKNNLPEHLSGVTLIKKVVNGKISHQQQKYHFESVQTLRIIEGLSVAPQFAIIPIPTNAHVLTNYFAQLFNQNMVLPKCDLLILEMYVDAPVGFAGASLASLFSKSVPVIDLTSQQQEQLYTSSTKQQRRTPSQTAFEFSKGLVYTRSNIGINVIHPFLGDEDISVPFKIAGISWNSIYTYVVEQKKRGNSVIRATVDALFAKFEQNPHLQKILTDTGEAELFFQRRQEGDPFEVNKYEELLTALRQYYSKVSSNRYFPPSQPPPRPQEPPTTTATIEYININDIPALSNSTDTYPVVTKEKGITITWRNVWFALLAARFTTSDFQRPITGAASLIIAFKWYNDNLGRFQSERTSALTPEQTWQELRVIGAESLLFAKFTKHMAARVALIQTGDAILYEKLPQELMEVMNQSMDADFWLYDTQTNKGSNKMGKILMKIRKNLAPKTILIDKTSMPELVDAIEQVISREHPSITTILASDDPDKTQKLVEFLVKKFKEDAAVVTNMIRISVPDVDVIYLRDENANWPKLTSALGVSTESGSTSNIVGRALAEIGPIGQGSLPSTKRKQPTSSTPPPPTTTVQEKPTILVSLTTGKVASLHNKSLGAEFNLSGKKWYSIEQYIQTKKYVDLDDRIRLKLGSLSPLAEDYKEIAKEVALAWNIAATKGDEWTKNRDQYMYLALHAKFEQNPHLKDMLVETGDAILLHSKYPAAVQKTKSEDYWDSPGRNIAGELLMKVRDEFKSSTTSSSTTTEGEKRMISSTLLNVFLHLMPGLRQVTVRALYNDRNFATPEKYWLSEDLKSTILAFYEHGIKFVVDWRTTNLPPSVKTIYKTQNIDTLLEWTQINIKYLTSVKFIACQLGFPPCTKVTNPDQVGFVTPAQGANLLNRATVYRDAFNGIAQDISTHFQTNKLPEETPIWLSMQRTFSQIDLFFSSPTIKNK